LIYGTLAGIAGLLLIHFASRSSLAWDLIAFCLFVVFGVICVLPHELGHAIGAWIVGMRVFTICIGTYGRIVATVQVFGHDLCFRSIPLGGYTLAVPKTTRLFRLRYFVVVLCGPLASCRVIAAALLLLQRFASNETIEWVIGVFVWSNLILLAIGLLPTQHNDGRLLLSVPFTRSKTVEAWHIWYFYLEGLESRERGKSDEAVRWFEQGLASYPNQNLYYFGLGMVYLDQQQYDEARQAFHQSLAPPTAPSGNEAITWNNIAWVCLLTGNSDLREEADRLSKQAYEQTPWVSQVKGTRGSVLVENDRIDEGIKLLEAALEENELTADRAFNACYLALANIRRHNLRVSDQYLQEARQLDADCPLIQRVVDALNAETDIPCA
jgi:tetratricopeptide (TPR) repeat protein